MAEFTLLSPGVLARENDQSQVQSQPLAVGAAIIGPTVRGPVEIPTIVTSYSDYLNKFGSTFVSGSQVYSYFTSIAAYNYFANGGETLLVARVVSGSYTSATASINSSVTAISAIFATSSDTNLGISAAITGGAFYLVVSSSLTSTSPFRYIFIPTSSGNLPDSNPLFFFASGSAVASTATNFIAKYNSISASSLSPNPNIRFVNTSGAIITISGSTGGAAQNGIRFFTGSTFTNLSQTGLLGGGADAVNSVCFTLKTISKGAIMNSSSPEVSGSLTSGSSANLKWSIPSVTSGSGKFDLLIRQGNDSNNIPSILEQWKDLSLDPLADNFITKVIGDYEYSYDSGRNSIVLTGSYPNASSYVVVSSVSALTPNFFDNSGNFKPAFTASYPRPFQSGGFGGALGSGIGSGGHLYYDNITTGNASTPTTIDKIQGIPSSSYNNMINLLANQDEYRFNILMTPGLFSNLSGHSSLITSIISNTEKRGDNIYVMDLTPYGQTTSQVSDMSSGRNTSYAATYWPWVQTTDPDSGKRVWVPASTVIGGVYAYNDSVAEPWFAPAGINRGGLVTVNRAEFKLSQGDRDTLYTNKINPIATFPGQGVVVYGQKTLQTKASALDRVNVRRLLIALKQYISDIARTLVFEQNTADTRIQFLNTVNPYLESVQQRQGLYAFKVIMDDSNNTPDTIDRNILVGAIYLQPTKTAEFIYLDFNILPTGATFPA
jgi:hypothetical protein